MKHQRLPTSELNSLAVELSPFRSRHECRISLRHVRISEHQIDDLKWFREDTTASGTVQGACYLLVARHRDSEKRYVRRRTGWATLSCASHGKDDRTVAY